MIQSTLIKSATLLVISFFTCCNNSKTKSLSEKEHWILNIETNLGTYCRDIDLSKYGAGDYTTHEKLTFNKGGIGQYSYSDFEQSFQQDFKWVVIDSNKVNIHYLGNVEKVDEELRITYDTVNDDSNSHVLYLRCL